jgi:hypothetical protein
LGKHLSDLFTIKKGFKQGNALSPLPFNFALEYAIRRVHVNQESLTEMAENSFWFMPMMLT